MSVRECYLNLTLFRGTALYHLAK